MTSIIFYLSFFMLSFGQEPQNSHERAAQQLLSSMNMGDNFSKTIDAMLDLQIQQNPSLSQHRASMKEFFDKYMSWKSLEGDFIKLYTDAFTETELNELNVFYQSDVGKKSIRLMPEMTRKGGELGQRRVQENIHELQKILSK